jgi:hypothetical protein
VRGPTGHGHGFGVFIHRADSPYEDSPATQYQFPKQYLSRVSQCVGDWIVYYEPTKVPGSKATTHSGEALSLKGRGE